MTLTLNSLTETLCKPARGRLAHTQSHTHTQGDKSNRKKMQYALRRQGGTLSESLSAHFRCGLKECTLKSFHNTAAFNLHLMNFRLKP